MESVGSLSKAEAYASVATNWTSTLGGCVPTYIFHIFGHSYEVCASCIAEFRDFAAIAFAFAPQKVKPTNIPLLDERPKRPTELRDGRLRVIPDEVKVATARPDIEERF